MSQSCEAPPASRSRSFAVALAWGFRLALAVWLVTGLLVGRAAGADAGVGGAASARGVAQGPGASAGPATRAAAPTWAGLNIQSDSVTVSGLSSGGYMAAQFQVAFSASVAGAALVAAGPYGCSHGSASLAWLECGCPAGRGSAAPVSLSAQDQRRANLGCRVPDDAELARRADAALARNRAAVDDPANLAGHRVWLMAGVNDPVVRPALVRAQAAFYRRHGVPEAAVRLRQVPGAGHGLPVPGGPVDCAVTATPFLNDCGEVDAAGELLAWLYAPAGRPALAQPAPAPAAHLLPFDQRPFHTADRFDGLDASGYVYIPADCAAGAACRLHIVFHGCAQGAGFRGPDGQAMGQRFAQGAGYNRWAESNRIVVLYPQVAATGSLVPGQGYNPQGCWDFWGYTDPNGAAAAVLGGYAWRIAPQMAAVHRMLLSLLGRGGRAGA